MYVIDSACDITSVADVLQFECATSASSSSWAAVVWVNCLIQCVISLFRYWCATIRIGPKSGSTNTDKMPQRMLIDWFSVWYHFCCWCTTIRLHPVPKKEELHRLPGTFAWIILAWRSIWLHPAPKKEELRRLPGTFAWIILAWRSIWLHPALPALPAPLAGPSLGGLIAWFNVWYHFSVTDVLQFE